MKKIMITLTAVFTAIFTIAASQLWANPYVGVDYLNSRVENKYIENPNSGLRLAPVNDETNEKGHGFSLFAGYKYDLNKNKNQTPFFAAEAFYDYLSLNSDGFFNEGVFSKATGAVVRINNRHDEISLNYRYGLKLKAGYEYEKFGIAGILGYSFNDYDVRKRDPGTAIFASNGKTEPAWLYGVELTYQFTPKITARFGIDRSDIDAKYYDNTAKVKMRLENYRLGLAYNF